MEFRSKYFNLKEIGYIFIFSIAVVFFQVMVSYSRWFAHLQANDLGARWDLAVFGVAVFFLIFINFSALLCGSGLAWLWMLVFEIE